MPFRTIPGSATQYGLLSFDRDGEERAADPEGIGGRLCARLVEIAADSDITDVFLFSHGWMGDVPAAVRQYDRWIAAFDGAAADREAAVKKWSHFRPLYIGLHWPSLPWGDEEIGDISFAGEGGVAPDELFRAYLARLGDTAEIRAALETIFDEARRNAAPDRLSDRARQALFDLNTSLGLGSQGVGGPPDEDREPFDPDAALEFGGEAAFGGFDVFDGLLGMVRVCSYWTMKKRARLVGEGGMHSFIKEVQRATAGRRTRVHLMGHSFGCVVISSILGGPEAQGPLERPIDSVVLAQGALSLWSYATVIPFAGAGAGYFHNVVVRGKVRGPLVTTQSRYDTAVGVQYPRASVLAKQIAFEEAEFPKYGAIGTFGLQGLADGMRCDCAMLPAHANYEFVPGKIYNLESSRFIANGSGPSGAHNDIAGPEVAHAIWQAALAVD
jgi:hypothetical protein